MPLILKYLIVYLGSCVKVILGPSFGLSFKLNPIIIMALTLAGMMTTVYVICYFGPQIRHLYVRIFGKKNRRVFTARNRRFVRVWKRWGVMGIAFLTPILLSPPGGAFLANAFGGKKEEIIKWMWVFGSVFSVVLTLVVKYASWLVKGLL